MRVFIGLFAVGWVLGVTPANADACLGKAEAPVPARAIAAGPSVVLTDGRRILMRGILVPAPPRDDKNVEAKRAAGKAKTVLNQQLKGKMVYLSDMGKPDRRSRLPAHIRIKGAQGASSLWLQGVLIGKGVASALGEGGPCAQTLIAMEDKARRARRGLWASGQFRVRRADRPGVLYSLVNSFQIVEGVVCAVGVSKKVAYQNFGDDWRRDFTIAVRGRSIKVQDLEGERLRVRGWLSFRNGPLMEVTNEAQIERLNKKQNPGG